MLRMDKSHRGYHNKILRVYILLFITISYGSFVVLLFYNCSMIAHFVLIWVANRSCRPIFMILHIAINLACTFELIESNPSQGTLQITSKERGPSFLVIEFPKITFPYLRNFNNIVEVNETDKQALRVIFYFTDSFTVNVMYAKILMTTAEYKWNAERGFYFPPLHLIKETKVVRSEPIFDIYYVPDFTVPFLAFNTCGCIFSLIFGFVVKAQLQKTTKHVNKQ